MTLRVTVLGSGSSSGVPGLDFGWGECDPTNPKNRRRRPGLIIEDLDTGTRVLIDTPPDLREQLLDADVERLDAVVYTHPHADHLNGIDDLRGINRRMQSELPVYADENTFKQISERFAYVLDAIPPKDDGSKPFFYKPVLHPHHVIAPGDRFQIGSLTFEAFDQDHGFSRTLGFRIGDFAYSTDVTRLEEAAFDVVRDVPVWMIAVLGWNDHPTHCHVDKAIEWVSRAGARRSVLGHLSPSIDYQTLKDYLPSHMEPAYDGMTFDI